MRLQRRTKAVALLMITACALALSCSGCREASVSGAIEASGTIEAEEVIVASEFGGRVEEILADEGDEVELGQALIHLDTQLLEAQIGQAEAAVSAAEANLARVESGARPGEIATAEAFVTQA
ncbi:MAG: biotin/lipoyl-binding protein, partial [Anaerolineae bacterium]